MKIKCPECEASLSIGAAKPGRYRPKCKHCAKPFSLKITADDPPKLVVRKYRKAEDKPKTSQSKPAPRKSAPKQDVAATMDSTDGAAVGQAAKAAAPVARAAVGAKQRSPVPAVDATIDSIAPSSPADDMQATMDSVAAAPDDVQATMDSVAAESDDMQATMDTVVPTSAAGGATVAGDAGATVDGDDSSASASKPSKSRVSKGRSASGSAVSRGTGSSSQSRVSSGRGAKDEAAIPERLGGYRILRLLGQGAMGAVYEAKQTSLDRLVALKTIRGRMANNPSSLARFTREAYAAAQLTHHNVVQIYDFGEDDGRHFFSMEWVRGGPLSDLIVDGGPIDARRAAGYVLQAARGLLFAHRNGMVHRDVKSTLR